MIPWSESKQLLSPLFHTISKSQIFIFGAEKIELKFHFKLHSNDRNPSDHFVIIEIGSKNCKSSDLLKTMIANSYVEIFKMPHNNRIEKKANEIKRRVWLREMGRIEISCLPACLAPSDMIRYFLILL